MVTVLAIRLQLDAKPGRLLENSVEPRTIAEFCNAMEVDHQTLGVIVFWSREEVLRGLAGLIGPLFRPK
jgi:hypothetical protein